MQLWEDVVDTTYSTLFTLDRGSLFIHDDCLCIVMGVKSKNTEVFNFDRILVEKYPSVTEVREVVVRQPMKVDFL